MDETYSLIGHTAARIQLALVGCGLLLAWITWAMSRGKSYPHKVGLFTTLVTTYIALITAGMFGAPIEWILFVGLVVHGIAAIALELGSSKSAQDRLYGAITKAVVYGGIAFLLSEIYPSWHDMGDTITLTGTRLLHNDGHFVDRTAMQTHASKPIQLDHRSIRDWGFDAPGPIANEIHVPGNGIYYGPTGFISGTCSVSALHVGDGRIRRSRSDDSLNPRRPGFARRIRCHIRSGAPSTPLASRDGDDETLGCARNWHEALPSPAP